MNDQETITKLKEQRDGLFACVNFALSNFKLPGGGSVMTTLPDGNMTFEPWTDWFVREIEKCGVKIDRDIMNYNRATQKEKLRMKKDPAFLAKLEKSRS